MRREFVKVLVVMLLVFLVNEIHSQNIGVDGEIWVDSVYKSLTLDERIAQLIFVRANQPNQPYFSDVDSLIAKYNVGGIVFFASDPVTQARQTNYWNSLTKTPLFISIDGEWGLGMRLSNTVKYPLQMTLGAIDDNNMIYLMGQQIGDQCKRMGIHINFAPVVDVNSDSRNPVIGMRSFGQNPEQVAEKGYYYMAGLQNKGIIASVKHFPGHGNTHKDSHKDLPEVNSSLNVLEEHDLYPFKYLVGKGVNSVMVAHLSVPALDDTPNHPTTLSYDVVTGLLKDKMGFDGLVITDALDMKGVTKYYGKGEVALKALMAGNDILLIPDDVEASIISIRDAVDKGVVSTERIEESCKKVLTYKYLTDAYKGEKIKTDNLIFELNNPIYSHTVESILESAITIVKNEGDILPLKDSLNTAVVILGSEDKQEFSKLFAKKGIKVFYMEHHEKKRLEKKLLKKLVSYENVVIAIVNTNILAYKNYGISEDDIQIVNDIAAKKNVVLNILACPYALDFFDCTLPKAIVISYQDKRATQVASAKAILERLNNYGTLPVDAGSYKTGDGIILSGTKLVEEAPQYIGADVKKLAQIDSIAFNGIEVGAFPGCQILAAKDGVVFYNKSFGFHTYNNKIPVRNDDVYDLASLTKILATTAAIMKLVDEGKININDYLSDYLLMLKGTDKENLGFMKVLAHQSGLLNWIPYYKSTISDNGWDTTIYSQSITEDFPIRVAENMYIVGNYERTIMDSIINSPFRDSTYNYSGLGFYILKKIVEDLSNDDFDDFVYQNFYNILGLQNLRFNPRKYFSIDRITPTENDTVFRKQLLQGDVHDQGAALLGGISGNAGLFGNAYDVAVMMQMFLNGGTYGNIECLKSETIDFFTEYHFEADSNRRGLGFDKPLLVYKDKSNNCKDASPLSFGHTGFTGTYAWADPENGLVYVFLSNRVYPDMTNGKLMKLDIRTNIHQLFYEAFEPEN